MKNVLKWMVTIAIMLTIIGNTAYIVGKVNTISNDIKCITCMMQTGIGSKATHSITGEIYGTEYVVTIKADDYGVIHSDITLK